ncbi:MAG: 3-hexulose-6-phosphate synthase [Lachnospiraceae bacterium]|nr:3-hexulose-6-phosphate synthase [Lachnospiraceae bacterium]
MKLQLALDIFSLEEALALTEKVKDYVDIIEIGTPFVVESGMEAVRRFRQAFPDKEILSDTKIMDVAELEAASAFEAGADYVTVLAVTDRITLECAVQIADKYGKKIVADMICVKDIPAKVAELEEIGVHCIAVHTGVDAQKLGKTPLEDLKLIKKYSKKAEVFVAGGISEKTIPEYKAQNPDVMIIGGGIGSAADPVKAAAAMAELIHH